MPMAGTGCLGMEALGRGRVRAVEMRGGLSNVQHGRGTVPQRKLRTRETVPQGVTAESRAYGGAGLFRNLLL
ncbi:MAG: hypothetical protein DCC68_15100 [Planctomycetota bacterium]|nr:MAG: hypothetical protein DCC68_15100 [Planctomycetota bacterium]